MDRLWQSLVVVVALALTALTSRPSVSDILKAERTRLAVTMPATATATAALAGPTVTQADVQAEEPPSVAPSPTPVILCQVCVLIDGEWQWLDECTRLYYYGKPCMPTMAPPTATALPATVEPTATVPAYP